MKDPGLEAELRRHRRALRAIQHPAHVLVVGDIILDRYLFGSIERLSPEAPVPVLDVEGDRLILGGAANVAANLHSLGARVTLCGLTGRDRDRKRLLKLMEETGLESGGLIADGSRPTSVKTRVIGQNQQIVRLDHESRHNCSGPPLRKLRELVGTLWEDLDAVVVSDYGKGVITPKLLDELRSLRRKRPRPVVVDPKDIHFQHYREFTIITPNQAEASLGAGFKIKDETTLNAAGKGLLESLGLEALLITLGSEGMALFQRDRGVMRIPTRAQEVFDVTGAGDTVSSVIAMALARGVSFEESAHLANFAAGVVVGIFGTAAVTAEGIRRAMDQYARTLRRQPR